MRALSASELLDIRERGLTQQPIQRALTLLAAACPETPPDALAKLSIGQRDAHLLTLREWVFGPQLVGLATCPGCGERLELTFNITDIRVAPGPDPAESTEELSLNVAGYEIHFRLPNSLDLAAVAGSEQVAESRGRLLQRCLLAIRHNGQERSADELPVDVIDAVVERITLADPQADVQLDLSCSSCAHQWLATFDIVSFFWTEIEAWGYRILRQVHTLAAAYGWREADILAMSPWRRRFYLEMVSG